MPPFRFLHAAGLDSDACLPEPPPALTDVFESAPLAAIERLVTRAIELRVDGLLLTPRAPTEGLPDGPGLALEAALTHEFDRLAAEAIPVLIAVGARGTGWERLADRDSKVLVLTPGSFAPLANLHGSPAAVLRCVEQPTSAARPVTPGPNDVLELAVAPRLAIDALDDTPMIRHDYLAVGLGPRSTATLAAGYAHSPGVLQGANVFDVGPHGATLVTVDEGHVAAEFVPTAAVRFESIPVQCEATDQIDDLAIRMTERLEQSHPEPGEQAWVVNWTIEAADALFHTLDNPGGRAAVIELLPEDVGGGVTVIHLLSVVPHPLWPAMNDPLAAEFAAALQEQADCLSDRSRRLALLDLPGSLPHRSRIARLIGETDATTVLGGARRFGLRVTTAATSDADE